VSGESAHREPVSGETVHATTVQVAGTGVLLLGPSGAGKSDLALRLMDRGASLVSDDYTALAVAGGSLIATAPERIAGRIELRGIGIVAMNAIPSAAIGLAVDLAGTIERMPEPATRAFLGVAIPIFALDPFAASAPIKIEILVRMILNPTP